MLIASDFHPNNFVFSLPQKMIATQPEYVATNTKLPYIGRAAGFILKKAPAIFILDGI